MAIFVIVLSCDAAAAAAIARIASSAAPRIAQRIGRRANGKRRTERPKRANFIEKPRLKAALKRRAASDKDILCATSGLIERNRARRRKGENDRKDDGEAVKIAFILQDNEREEENVIGQKGAKTYTG